MTALPESFEECPYVHKKLPWKADQGAPELLFLTTLSNTTHIGLFKRQGELCPSI